MADVYHDRVRETTQTSGTGTLTLLGAVAQFQAFSSIGNGNTCRYTLTDANGVDWEVGSGTWYTGGTFTRDTVYESSNSGSLISLSGGISQVFISPDATLFNTQVGFYGHATTALQTLSTGVSASVDDVIAFLQLVGLCVQASTGSGILTEGSDQLITEGSDRIIVD